MSTTCSFDQFRSVESEEEEEEKAKCETFAPAKGKKALEKKKHGDSSVSSKIFHFIEYGEVDRSNRGIVKDSEDQERDNDDDYLESSEEEYVEMATRFSGEGGQIPDRDMQNRYQGFIDRVDFSVKVEGRVRDRSDHATTSHALDGRTRNTLFNLMRQKYFHTIDGCVSTGKEANVYHAIGTMQHSGKSGQRSSKEVHYGIKVYMTSTTSFRDRDQYVSGDFRMRNCTRHSSSYAMVKDWAEKEFRNLCRIHNNGKICAPRAVKLKGVVLLMDFIGDDDGYPAPRLKDANLHSVEEWRALYWQIVRQMRILHQECGLVHGDLNEYNLLYYDDRAWFIDVSQSVMHEKNPNALGFLRKDCNNITLFFRSHGVFCLTVRELFHFIVSTAVGGLVEGVLSPDPVAERDAAEEDHFARVQTLAENRPDDWEWEEAGAFLHEHIPLNLFEVDRAAQDIRSVRHGKASADDLPYASMSGLKTEDFLSLKAKLRLEMKRQREEKKMEKEKKERVEKKEKEEKEKENVKTEPVEEKTRLGKDENEERRPGDEASGEGENVESSGSNDGEGSVGDNKQLSRFNHPSRERGESPASRRQRKAEVKEAQRKQRMEKKERRLEFERKERAKKAQKPKFTRLT